MQNLKDHTREIDSDYLNYYYALYMKREWGIEVGYKIYPEYWINLRKTLCDYQNLNDCGALCTESLTSGF